jgi:hypothetical protein
VRRRNKTDHCKVRGNEVRLVSETREEEEDDEDEEEEEEEEKEEGGGGREGGEGGGEVNIQVLLDITPCRLKNN